MISHSILRSFFAALCSTLAALAPLGRAELSIEFQTVGDAGNPPDTSPLTGPSYTGGPRGQVDHVYRIGKTELTNAQYVEFLNKVEPNGDDSALHLYNPQMGTDLHGGILYDSAAAPGQHFAAKEGFASKSVIYVCYLDAMRFCNWLHNGQPAAGGTETGAYTLNGDLTNGLEARNAGARFWIPTEDEWYKAAFYDPTRSPSSPGYDPAGGPGPYWLYTTRSDFAPTATFPNSTNADSANYNDVVNMVTDVGSYSQAGSYYGTFDQGGNVWDMTDAIYNGSLRILRGAAWSVNSLWMQSAHSTTVAPTTEADNMGFRVATVVSPTAVQVPTGARLRIVPLGDSITQGDGVRWSYRYKLWTKLLDAGVNFDFVGSRNYNDGSTPDFPPYHNQTFDADHEGHTFYRSDEIRNGLPFWMDLDDGVTHPYTPDVALMHVGTNDAFQAVPAATTAGYLKDIIDLLRARNPRVVVLLAKLIPTTYSPADSLIVAINDQICGIAAEKSTLLSPVIVVDQFTGFDAVADTLEGVHPSPSGEEKMAQRWFEALQLFVATPTVSLDATGHPTLRYLRIKAPTRLFYAVEVSGDLQLWNSGADATEDVSIIDTSPDLETVETRDLQTATPEQHRYIRLRLNYAP